MNVVDAVILGLVEGVTEYLPVSSTGHLVLARALLGLDAPALEAPMDAFLIIVQGGAILAVLGLYWPRVAQMLAGIRGADPAGRRLAVNLAVAFAPAAVAGPLLNKVIEDNLFDPLPVVAALAAGGVVMIAIGPWQRRHFEAKAGDEGYVDIEHLTWRQALVIGALQCVAMWPGTSRSMVTIVGGMLVGMRARQAAEFSFLLALPTLTGACLWRLAKSVGGAETSVFTAFGWVAPLAGLAVATVSAAVAVRWLVSFLGRHGLSVFGWYRLAVAVAYAAVMGLGSSPAP